MANLATLQAGAGLCCSILEHGWHQLVAFDHLDVFRHLVKNHHNFGKLRRQAMKDP